MSTVPANTVWNLPVKGIMYYIETIILRTIIIRNLKKVGYEARASTTLPLSFYRVFAGRIRFGFGI